MWIVEQVKRDGRGRPYDCIVGISGGRDTCYCLYMTKQLGLRPLAVHFDNGWDSEIAKTNLRNVLEKLDVDLHTVVADWEESRELTNCTIRASLPYLDMTDDVGIVSALYRTAAKEKIRWIIHSHSFRSEGINPLKWNYMDGRLVRQIILPAAVTLGMPALFPAPVSRSSAALLRTFKSGDPLGPCAAAVPGHPGFAPAPPRAFGRGAPPAGSTPGGLRPRHPGRAAPRLRG